MPTTRPCSGHGATSQLVLVLVSTAVFALLHISPVPVERVIGGPRATTDTLDQIRHNLGLDQPVLVQYWHFLEQLARGDLGFSYINQTPVIQLIADRLPTTLWLVLGAGVVNAPSASPYPRYRLPMPLQPHL
jgi:ABC-type dipeptide/oligopeptide/nickel transport system permease component